MTTAAKQEGHGDLHWHVPNFERSFVLFNDDGQLGMESVDANDIEPVTIDGRGEPFASAAWSAGCDWYFIVMRNGIALLSVASGRGYFCKKKSAMFIDLFLSAPYRKRKRRP